MEKFILKEKEFKANTALAYEGLFTLGSGYLHTRGSLEENVGSEPQNITNPRPAFANASAFRHGGVQKTKWGTYVPGIFAHHPNLNEEIVNLPYFLGIEPRVGGEKLDLLQCKISGYERVLNMKTASLERSLVWHTKNGNVGVKFERFISGVRPHLSVQRATFTAETETVISIKSGIDADVRTNGCDHFEFSLLENPSDNSLKSTVRTNTNPYYDKENKITNTSGGDTIYTIVQVKAEKNPLREWNFSMETRGVFFVADFGLSAGETLVIEKRAAVATSRDLASDAHKVQTAEEILLDAEDFTYGQLFDEHKKHWAKRWELSDVVIENDDKSQTALRASLFHLLRCHVTDDPRVAIDAKGTAGDIYYGRFFWDTEIYLLPFFLYTDPQRARTLVDFRNETLEGAKRNAKNYGYSGARFPWESDNQGNDCCPPGNWQYRDHEIHITADVVYAFAHYAANTDESYLADAKTASTIVETARYWLDRVDWADGVPHLLGVMGPDEYTALTSDNAYTNYMAAFALNLAVKYGKFGGATDEEIKKFKDVAEKLPVIRSEENQNLIMQCAEFDKLADPQFARFWKGYKNGKPVGHYAQYVPQERLYRTKSLKQADVLMLMFLFFNKFRREEILAAWDYYAQYTTHDSSLSLGAHAMLANRIGKEEEAWDMFQKCIGTDLDVEKEGAAEGIHIAGCGMNWQMIVFGVAGILNALQSDIFTLEPHLPKQWTKVSFPFIWKQQPLYISLEKDKTTIENRSGKAIDVAVNGQKRTLEAGEIFIN
jgi:kojibiose phosphorylase